MHLHVEISFYINIICVNSRLFIYQQFVLYKTSDSDWILQSLESLVVVM